MRLFKMTKMTSYNVALYSLKNKKYLLAGLRIFKV